MFYIDGSRFIAGPGFYGSWQAQVLDCVREAQAAGAILVLGHVIDLLDAGKTVQSDQNVAQLLSPVLASRDLALFAEATTEEWAQIERRNAGFARNFVVARVDDPPEAVVARIAGLVAKDLTAERRVRVLPAAVAEVQALCARFVPYGALLGNTITFLRRLVAARAQAMAAEATAADAIARFTSELGIPLRLVDDRAPLDEADVRAFLAS